MKNAITIIGLAVVLAVAGCVSNEKESEISSDEFTGVKIQQGDSREKTTPPMKPIKMTPPAPASVQKPDPKNEPEQKQEPDKVRVVEEIKCEWDVVRALRRSHTMMLDAAEIFAAPEIPNEEAFERALKLQYGVEKNISKIMTYYYEQNASAQDCRIIYELAIAQDLLTVRTKEIAAHWAMLSEREKSQQDEIARFEALRKSRCERQKALAQILKDIDDALERKIAGDE